VTTLRDAAGAGVAEEALTDRGIPVEIRRLGVNAYFGSPTAEEFEVRVPAERVDEAQAVLAALEGALAEVLLAQAGVPPGADDLRGSTDLPPPELRPRKLSWAVALGLVGPVPGCGLLYARAFRVGWTFVGASLALFAAAVVAGNSDALVIIAALKGADIVLAPFAAARFNRQLVEGADAASA
jgi:hypothetical protein